MGTGPRLGELLAIQWQHVDFNSQRVEIRHALWEGKLVRPKTEASVRAIHFGPALLSVFTTLRQTSDHIEADDFVFSKKDGSPLNPDLLRRDVLYPTLDRLGINRSSRAAGFHTFRHSSATIVNQQTGNLKLVQKLLGHSNLGTTASAARQKDSDTRVIPPAPVSYADLAFSPDGNYLYFRKAEDALNTTYFLYRAPVLGGTPQIIVRDIDSDLGFSPDGHRMTYIRDNDPEVGKYRLLTANLDGNDEKVLLIAPAPANLSPSNVSWSPDGKQIAISLFPIDDGLSAIATFDINNNKLERLVTFQDKMVNELKWASDGSGLFVIYQQAGPNYYRAQVAFLSLGNDALQPTTRDTNGYKTLTRSADGRTLATVQVKAAQMLYLVPGAGSTNPEVPPVLPHGEYVSGFGWKHSDNLLVGESGRLLRMATDGSNSNQILGDGASRILEPVACSDRYLVFNWQFHAGSSRRNLWRANADGSNPVKLTDVDTQRATCSPDQKWVYFRNVAINQVWRVALDGSGKAEAMARATAPKTFLFGGRPAISPDGKTLANVVITALNPESMTPEDLFTLIDPDSDTEPRVIKADPRIATAAAWFTPDGKALAYAIRENGVDNIWLQPLDGSAGKKITNFNADQITDMQWSPDGKTLGILRTHSDSDVVLLQETKP